MRVLFVDDSHPGHFRHLPGYLAGLGHEVTFAHQLLKGPVPEGIRSLTFPLTREPMRATHPYLRRFERSVLGGLSLAGVARDLRAGGYRPDVIMGFSGWGPPFFLKDVWPDTPLVLYNDIWYWPRDSNYDFYPGRRPTVERASRILASNAPNAWDLAVADRVMVTTRFQLSTFPTVLWPKISVIHDGIDTETFSPLPTGAGPNPGFRYGDLDLRGAPELVTYVTRGMEPYRGFDTFLRAVELLQRRRPHLQVVVGGVDDVFYSFLPPDGGRSWKTYLLGELDLDLSRLHFTGPLPLADLVSLLRSSDAHAYLTAPFIPSWSMFEAMAAGALVVGSATAPVQELATDGVHALLCAYPDDEALAERLAEALDRRSELAGVRAAARERIVERYALPKMLARQAAMLADVAAGRPGHEVTGAIVGRPSPPIGPGASAGGAAVDPCGQ